MILSTPLINSLKIIAAKVTINNIDVAELSVIGSALYKVIPPQINNQSSGYIDIIISHTIAMKIGFPQALPKILKAPYS